MAFYHCILHLRYLDIDILSNEVGITGNMLSGIFLVNTIEVGASSSLFGLYSIYIVDYFVNWKYYRKPGRKILIWIIVTLVSLVLGLLPGIDNFAHIGGAWGGLCSTLVR
jgi:hypothetical protein